MDSYGLSVVDSAASICVFEPINQSLDLRHAANTVFWAICVKQKVAKHLVYMSSESTVKKGSMLLDVVFSSNIHKVD